MYLGLHSGYCWSSSQGSYIPSNPIKLDDFWITLWSLGKGFFLLQLQNFKKKKNWIKRQNDIVEYKNRFFLWQLSKY